MWKRKKKPIETNDDLVQSIAQMCWDVNQRLPKGAPPVVVVAHQMKETDDLGDQ